MFKEMFNKYDVQYRAANMVLCRTQQLKKKPSHLDCVVFNFTYPKACHYDILFTIQMAAIKFTYCR